MSPRLTQDGSYTFFSAEFGEAYHSLHGAKTESFEKFATVTRLEARAKAGRVKILDVCYGLGYNSAAALETIWSGAPECCIEVVGLELDPHVLKASLALETFGQWSDSVQAVLTGLAEHHRFQMSDLQAEILLGDARQSIQRLIDRGWQADAIFLDPFSPRRCPQLWTVEFLADVAACLTQTGLLATYSRSAAVRNALTEAGLKIGTVPIAPHQVHLPHAWSQGTLASYTGDELIPLSQMEQEHLQTKAGIPLRDPQKSASAVSILDAQARAQQASSRESSSSWRRRWQMT